MDVVINRCAWIVVVVCVMYVKQFASEEWREASLFTQILYSSFFCILTEPTILQWFVTLSWCQDGQSFIINRKATREWKPLPWPKAFLDIDYKLYYQFVDDQLQ